MAAAAPAGPPEGFVSVFNAEEVPTNGNRCVLVEGRGIVLYRRSPRRDSLSTSDHVYGGSSYYAMDAVCYHMGGPLKEAAIEDIGGREAAVCPWHRYRITLDTGEGLYQPTLKEWKSKGKRQRVHPVWIDQSSGQLYVRVSTPERDGGEVASDTYARRFLELKLDAGFTVIGGSKDGTGKSSREEGKEGGGPGRVQPPPVRLSPVVLPPRSGSVLKGSGVTKPAP